MAITLLIYRQVFRKKKMTNILDTHLEIPGLQYQPAGETSESFSVERPAIFKCSLHARNPGVYSGNLWVNIYTKSSGNRNM